MKFGYRLNHSFRASEQNQIKQTLIKNCLALTLAGTDFSWLHHSLKSEQGLAYDLNSEIIYY